MIIVTRGRVLLDREEIEEDGRCQGESRWRDDQGLGAAGFCGLGTLGEWKGGIDWMAMILGRYVAIKTVWISKRRNSWQE